VITSEFHPKFPSQIEKLSNTSHSRLSRPDIQPQDSILFQAGASRAIFTEPTRPGNSFHDRAVFMLLPAVTLVRVKQRIFSIRRHYSPAREAAHCSNVAYVAQALYLRYLIHKTRYLPSFNEYPKRQQRFSNDKYHLQIQHVRPDQDENRMYRHETGRFFKPKSALP
jgi:hypothetical protein